MAGTFDGTLTSGQIIDLGKVGVKSGSYSVEISSSKTTLQPFRANVKPAQPKASQPLEEEVVVIDLDSVGQSISEGNSNDLGNLESNAVTLGKVGSIPGQSMESPDVISFAGFDGSPLYSFMKYLFGEAFEIKGGTN